MTDDPRDEIEDILNDWVNFAHRMSCLNFSYPRDKKLKNVADEMRWMYLSEPHLISTKIVNLLVRQGWTPPERENA